MFLTIREGMLDMSGHLCSEEEWSSKSCCYGDNPNSECDRETLLTEATQISDFWYTTLQECKDTDFDLVDRPIARVTKL